MGNLIAFMIFTLVGGLVVYLTLVTDFSMANMAWDFSRRVNSVALALNAIPGANVIFSVLIVLFLVFLVRQVIKSKNE